MTRSCSRIALIERPINEPIEKHRCRAGKYHTNNHQEQNSPRGPAVCCHNQRAKRKRQRKDRVRKTNQLQKTTDRSAFDLAHDCRREDFLQKAINETKVLTEFIKPLSYLRFLSLTVYHASETAIQQTSQPFTCICQNRRAVREKHSLGFKSQKF